MRVLVWANVFFPYIGGVQVLASQLLPALRARGHEISVLTTHRRDLLPDASDWEGIPVHRFQFQSALDSWDGGVILQERRRAAELLRRVAPELVHVLGFGVTDFFQLESRKAHSAPTLVTLQSEDSRMLHTHGRDSLIFRMLERSDWVTTVSRVELEQLVRIEPRLDGRISCIYNTVKAPALAPGPLPETPRLLALGRLSPTKSFDIAIRAFARVFPVMQHARLIVAGDGRERASLERLAAELGVREAVEFKGWVAPAQIPALINQVTAVILPSQSEGLPLAGIETALMARPLLATWVGGLPELVLDGETGLLTAPGDDAALAAAIELVLATPERARAMGRAAQRRVRDLFSFDRMVDAYDQVYRRVGHPA
jgi:glycogen(starch) synthase